MGFDESTPPEQLIGKEPPSLGVAVVGHLPALALLGDECASSHMGSCQENGTYSSAMSSCWRGRVMPAWA